MEVDFTHGLPAPAPYGGWLEKKGSLRKNWKLRYFYLADGILKYYGKGPSSSSSPTEGGDLKGDLSLLGAEISIFEGLQLHITLHGEKKAIFYVRAKTNKEANDWLMVLQRQIQYQNTIALQNGSRSPEIVEWYYQYQTETCRKNIFLQKSVEVYLHFGQSSTVSIFHITMNEEKTGLVLSIIGTTKKFNRLESINNGRIIMFTDIAGVKLTSGWELSNNRFLFDLKTAEDELSFEMDAFGVTWLQGVQEMVLLTKIPKPSARSVSISPAGRVMSSNMNSLIEFSSNSGAVFTCSNDVQMILEGFNRVTGKTPIILEISSRLNTILKLIPDLRYNRETGSIFGERIEEIIRILGDTENGILFVSRESDKSLINFHLSTLNNKLNDVVQYFLIQCRSGWLIQNLNSKPTEMMRQKIEHFDYELTTIVNILIKALGLSPTLLMDKKEYTMTVDIKKSIEALGGIDAIYHDVAKERALARLIQAEGHEIHNELVEFIKQGQNGSDSLTSGQRKGSKDRNKYRVSMDHSNSKSVRRSCWSYIFCCCFTRDDVDPDKSNYQLYEEKNIITVSSNTNPIHYNSRRSSRSRMSRGSQGVSPKVSSERDNI